MVTKEADKGRKLNATLRNQLSAAIGRRCTDRRDERTADASVRGRRSAEFFCRCGL